MCVHVAANNFESPLRLFLLLKFLYREGKAKLSDAEIKDLAKVLGYRKKESIQNNIQKLLSENWLIYNRKTGYYLISSFKSLAYKYEWKSRAAGLTYPEYLNDTRGFTGAVIFAYLHQNIVRKQRRGKFVLIQGDTFSTFPVSSPYNPFKPVAITGVNAIFSDISLSKIARIKSRARDQNLLDVKKNFAPLDYSKSEINLLQRQYPNIIMRKGKYYLQQIDTILPQIHLRKRRKVRL